MENEKKYDEKDSDDENGKDKIPEKCLNCGINKLEYKCFPCGCPTLCKTCAMKMATGGKCKSCKKMFGELSKVFN